MDFPPSKQVINVLKSICYMGPSYLKRCAICKQCTLVWTQTPDMFRGFAANVTGPGHNCFLRVYGNFWFIFAWGTQSILRSKPEFGSWGSIHGGVGCPLRTNNRIRDGKKLSIDRNFRSNQHCDRIRFRSRFDLSNCPISIRSKCDAIATP